MPWAEITVEAWQQFDEQIISRDLRPLKRQYIYRGQANALWGLRPTLTRLFYSLDLHRRNTHEIESLLLRRFKARAHLYLPAHLIPPGDKALDWLTLMQHYRAPTRILDWTYSPLVALYFAVNMCWDHDGAVWCVHRHYFSHRTDPEDSGPDDDNLSREYERWIRPDPGALSSHVIAFDRSRLTERMAVQQGAFTIAPDVALDHRDGLQADLPELIRSERAPMKIIVPKHRKREFLARLNLMNITAEALFPGADGLGTELEELVRLW